MEVGTIIKQRRLDLGLTMKQVADKMGVAEATISRWESGNISNMRRDKIKLLADALFIKPEVLMGWSNDIKADNDITAFENINQISRIKIPLLGEIACGTPIYACEDRESYVEIGTRINADFCLKCKGDSMIGARIHDGDIVFVKKQSIVNNGEIAVVIINNEATLKRVFYEKDKEKLVLQSENPAYAPLVYVGEELNEICILGKAVAFQSDVK